MKFAVYPETSVEAIPAEINEIVLVRPVSIKKLERVLRKCWALKKITLSKSCHKRLGKKTQKILQENSVSLNVENNAGRAISIDLERMLKVIEMRKDFRPLREIESVTGIPKSTIHYLTKHSQRKKVKKGKETIYLK